MHKNTQKPTIGMARSKDTVANPKIALPANVPPTPKPRGIVNNGASFDNAQSLSDLKKLQDATKFDKARFSFRLYKR